MPLHRLRHRSLLAPCHHEPLPVPRLLVPGVLRPRMQVPDRPRTTTDALQHLQLHVDTLHPLPAAEAPATFLPPSPAGPPMDTPVPAATPAPLQPRIPPPCRPGTVAPAPSDWIGLDLDFAFVFYNFVSQPPPVQKLPPSWEPPPSTWPSSPSTRPRLQLPEEEAGKEQATLLCETNSPCEAALPCRATLRPTLQCEANLR